MPKTARALALLAAVLSLAVASPAAAGRTIKLKVPRFEVPPRTDREICTFVRVPMKKDFDLSAITITNVGIKEGFTTHHFLMWKYEGTDLDAFPPKGTLIDDTACLDFGPADTNQRTLIGGSQSPKLVTRLPAGVAQNLKPAVVNGRSEIGIILNSHWINSGDKTQRAAVKIKLIPAKKHTVKRHLLPIFEVFANAFINVPPGQVKTVSGAWGPGTSNIPGGLGGGATTKGPACVVMVTSHMHKRGRLFTIDGVDHGQVTHPEVLKTTSYTDPPQIDFVKESGAPMLLLPGQGLRYQCTHDNGVETQVRMGCEEVAGVTPGLDVVRAAFKYGLGKSGAAKRCTTDADCAAATDPAFPQRTFTGKCVPANLVFGYTSEDDMCIMPGGFYEANEQGNCDLSALPPLN